MFINSYRNTIISLLLLCSLTGSLRADESDSVLQFLKISPAPEASSLGNAYISIQGNAHSLYYNPALSSFFTARIGSFIYTPDTYSLYVKNRSPLLKSINFSLSYARYYQSLNYGSLFSTFSLRRIGTFGIGLISLIYDEIPITDIDSSGNYVETGKKMNVGDYCLIINYGYRITENIGVGVNLKGIMEKLHDVTGKTFAADLGFLYIKDQWGVGLSVQNLGMPIKFDQEENDLPLDFTVGGHYEIKYKKLLISPKDKITASAKVTKGVETEFITGLGLEYSWQGIVFLRAGYQIAGVEEGFKAGAGIKYINMNLDYGITFHKELGMVHRIGLAYKWDNKNTGFVVEEKGKLLKASKRGLEIGIQSDKIFKPNTAEFRDDAYDTLDKVVDEVKRSPGYVNIIYIVRIEGNTDDSKKKELSLDLSQKRANAVFKYFADKGIDKKNMVAVGLGENNPLVTNDSFENRMLNRRMDVVLIEKKEEKTASKFIDELPKAEREEIEKLFYFGLDKYYKEDRAGAVQMWKQIKTDNPELQEKIREMINKAEQEMKNKK
ncbi:MAG: PorV/PorQ family protein [bacterium]|nr:PorV/PorQ family protein [bacterium]